MSAPRSPTPEALLGAALRGEAVCWPFGGDEAALDAWLERARYHGVMALLHEYLQSKPVVAAGWPPALVQACRDVAIAQAMWELRHRSLLTQVLDALAAEGVQPVLFKGTALAYGLYGSPSQRTRGDTDLLIAPRDRVPLERVLGSLGFGKAMTAGGQFASYQASHSLVDPATGEHALDVHWRINNAEVLARLFSHEELLARSVPIESLGPHARAVDPADALLIACMHRATHKVNPYYVDGVAHYEADRLIWLLDIVLLARSLSPVDTVAFVRRAREKELMAVCRDGLDMARRVLDPGLRPDLLVALTVDAEESPWRYLTRGPAGQKWMDLMALGSWRRRGAYVREVVFPRADYMRWKFSASGGTPLAWLYLRRAVAGCARQLLRPRS
jgi:Uncharacterised nucleotidyltransferase